MWIHTNSRVISGFFYHHPKQRWMGQLVKNDLIFIINKYIWITYIQISVNVKLFNETQV